MNSPAITKKTKHYHVLVVLAFFAIYFIWGATYLAIRYAVATIPPLMTAATRHLIAGSILLAWAWSRGFRPTSRQWIAALKVGALYFLVGHGTLHWAEQRVASGMAALLIATEPMIISVLALVAGEERLTPLTIAGMFSGLIGVGVLVGGSALSHTAELIGVVAVLISAVGWSLGVHFSRRVGLPSDAFAASAMTLLTGSGLLWIAATLRGEVSHFQISAVSLRSVLGLGFLIFFGTIVAFTSYTWLLSHMSPTIVSTHTYVNPVVAVLLGWALAGEPVNARILIAGAVILGSVVLIGQGTQKAQVVEELAACEQ